MSSYCVYLTIYYGNKMPKFYLGSSSLNKVSNGYHGSVASKEYGNIWKQELRENPSLFKTVILSEHQSRAEAFEREEYLQKARKVVTNIMYVNLSYANSKFSLKQHSPWTRNKFKERVPWNKGLKLTDEIYKKGAAAIKERLKVRYLKQSKLSYEDQTRKKLIQEAKTVCSVRHILNH